MKRILKIMQEVTVMSFMISLISFCAAALGGLIESPTLVLVWYLGLVGLWVMLVTLVATGILKVLDSGLRGLRKRTGTGSLQRNHHPHTAA